MRPFVRAAVVSPYALGFATHRLSSNHGTGLNSTHEPNAATQSLFAKDMARVVSTLRAISADTNCQVRLSLTSDAAIRIDVCTGSRTNEWKTLYKQGTERVTSLQQILDKLPEVLNRIPATTAAGSPFPQAYPESEPSSSSSNQTWLDLSCRSDDITLAKSVLSKRYPRLKVGLLHTSGTDIQGQRTHTVTAALRERYPGGELTNEERNALENFRGEAIGLGYTGTVCRALKEAFGAIKETFPTHQSCLEDSGQVSTISLYTNLLKELCAKFHITVSVTGSQVEVRMNDGERVLYSLTGHSRHTLSLLLSAAENAAEKVDVKRTKEVRCWLSEKALILVLPREGIRVKNILRHLLHYHYGLTHAQVEFNVEASAHGVFVCHVNVILTPPYFLSSTGTSEDGCGNQSAVTVCIASATGTAKKDTTEMACVKAMEEHFPRIYEEQISFHAEIQAILASPKTAKSGPVRPPLAKGLQTQLEWAFGTEGLTMQLHSTLQRVKTSTDSLGTPLPQAVWATQLFCFSQNGDTDDRELVSSAFDVKKSRSEQKAVAVALHHRFPLLCKESVDFAVKRGLINDNGVPPPTHMLPESIQEQHDGELTAVADAFSNSLQLGVPCDIPVSVEGPSLLEVYRDATQQYVDHQSRLQGIPWRLSESVEYTPEDAARGHYRVVLRLVAATEGVVPDVVLLATALDRYEVAAVLAAHKALFSVNGAISTAAMKDAEVDGIVKRTSVVVEAMVKHYTQLPKQNTMGYIADAIMRIYGLPVFVCLSSTGRHLMVELYCRRTAEALSQAPREMNSAEAGVPAGMSARLGYGKGLSAASASMRCCHHVFEAHLRPQQARFKGRQLPSGCVQVSPLESSRLGQLICSVITEINCVSGSADLCTAHLQLRFDQQRASFCDLAFMARSTERTVQLEDIQCTSDVYSALRELGDHIRMETGAPPLEAKGVVPVFHTAIQLLEGISEKVFGLSISTELVFCNSTWYCRLSAILGEEHRCALSCTSSARKKDAVEEAARMVLRRYMPAESASFLVPDSATMPPSTEDANYIYTIAPEC